MSKETEPAPGSATPATPSPGQPSGQPVPASGSPSAGAPQPGAAPATPAEMVPKAELEKLQGDLDNFKRIEEERKAKEKKRQEELLKEQGKYKELYENAAKEAEAAKAQLSKLETAMAEMVEEEMKDLPAEFDKSLIPNLESHEKIAWLRKAKNAFVKKTEPRKGDGTPPASGEGLASMMSIFTHPMSPKH